MAGLKFSEFTRWGWNVQPLLFYTAIRLGECAVLNLEDVCICTRKGVVIIRSGKGDAYPKVPLNTQVREALRLWLKE